nr:helix-hairpin-helix domain-containing protein [uncultured Flavobacterium sp.]
MNTSFYFKYTREQRSGIVVLVVVMIIIQLGYCFYFSGTASGTDPETKETKEWLAMQSKIDSLKTGKGLEAHKIYPFNPNFISDYKGYTLGLTPEEINRLHAFRKGNKFVNSAKEFQIVTRVSDKLLAKISPYFKFPDWVNNKKQASFFKEYPKQSADKKEVIKMMDINVATQEELMKVYGIGPALSERILKEREKFGAFVSMEQLKEVWGLSPEVIENLYKHFKILSKPTIKKLSINTASVKEMMQLPFFKYYLAKEIVTYRSMNGEIKNKEDLLKIKNFPIDKVDLIALYLDF